MLRCALIVGLLLGGVPAFGQRAQLPRKGRMLERAAPQRLEPIRRLPRGRGGAAPDAPRSPLDELLTRMLSEPRAPEPLPVDRARLLVRTSPRGVPLELNVGPGGPYATLPRKPANEDTLAGLLPVFVRPDAPESDGRPVTNRWRIPFPEWQRYDNAALDTVYAKSRRFDPFNRNRLKGDYPLFGRRNFLDVSASSETSADLRRLPVPSGASADLPGQFGFFGNGNQFFFAQNFRLSFDLFRGSAGFRPVDWEVRITPEFNVNFLKARENGIALIDVRQGTTRVDGSAGLQEAFIEKRLFTNSTAAFRRKRDADDQGSAYFDFTSLRVGIQRFTSDFRGFVFSDEQPGTRLFGTFRNNVFQYNLAYFNLLGKDAITGLNRWRTRNQSVYAANLYWNDFLTLGYNLNFSLLYNNDQPTFLVDKNGFLVRPAPIGNPQPHKIRAGYAGISGDGHIGRYNISHAFYQAFGNDSFHPIPATNNRQRINAQLAALELAYERDWMIWKVSAFYTSGDGDLDDGTARGFDAIVPNQQFAGGGFLSNAALADRGLINNRFLGGGINFLNRSPIPLTGTGLMLFGPNSLIPSMRAGFFEGQANFINPGILLGNAGIDAKLTPKLRGTVNVNYARFMRTEVLEAVLFQSGIRKGIGVDAGLGAQYRPLLNDNLVVTGGFGALIPSGGFNNIYNGRSLYSGFVNVRAVF